MCGVSDIHFPPSPHNFMMSVTKVTIMQIEGKNCHIMVNSSTVSLLLLHPYGSEMKCRNYLPNISECIVPFSSVFRCLASPADQVLVTKFVLQESIHLEGSLQATSKILDSIRAQKSKGCWGERITAHFIREVYVPGVLHRIGIDPAPFNIYITGLESYIT